MNNPHFQDVLGLVGENFTFFSKLHIFHVLYEWIWVLELNSVTFPHSKTGDRYSYQVGFVFEYLVSLINQDFFETT